MFSCTIVDLGDWIQLIWVAVFVQILKDESIKFSSKCKQLTIMFHQFYVWYFMFVCLFHVWTRRLHYLKPGEKLIQTTEIIQPALAHIPICWHKKPVLIKPKTKTTTKLTAFYYWSRIAWCLRFRNLSRYPYRFLHRNHALLNDWVFQCNKDQASHFYDNWQWQQNETNRSQTPATLPQARSLPLYLSLPEVSLLFRSFTLVHMESK